MSENAFEAQRSRRIASNNQFMQEMGVLQAAGDLCALMQPKAKCAGVKRPLKPKDAQQPARASTRIKDLEVKVLSKREAEYAAVMQEAERKPLFELTTTTYTAPFTLLSSGVTVLKLGKVYRQKGRRNYWSSWRSLFRHAFPVGFIATKTHNGRSWRMSITAGDREPVFTVTDEAAGRSYSASSASAAWASTRQSGSAGSGYEFFGFQELTFQRAIAAQYTVEELAHAQYNDVLRKKAPKAVKQGHVSAANEKAAAAAATSGSASAATTQARASSSAAAAAEVAVAAVAGSKAAHPTKSPERSPLPPLRWLTPVQLFAKELQLSVRGMCSATADALASTTALGGVWRSSLAGLKQWLAADEGNEELLRAFLHEVRRSRHTSR